MYEKEQYMENENKELKNKIADELTKIKYSFGYVGTKYLLEAIYIIIVEDKNKYDLQIDIYPVIAKKYHINTETVKSNIRNATDKMCEECKHKDLSEYMGYDLKPTSKRIIKSVIEKICA